MRVPPVESRRRPLGRRAWLIGGAILLVVLLLSLRGLARFYTDYLWFKDVGFTTAWRRLLSAKVVPALIFSTIFFVLMLVNLIVADRVAPRYRSGGPEDEVIERYRSYVAPYAGRVRVLVSLFFALVMGSGVTGQWQNWLLFSNATKFGIKDPQFHKDIGFYVFRLPFLQFAASWTFAALLVVLIVSAVFHYLNGGIRLQSPFQRVTPQVKVHISVLLALMSLTKTVQYYLARFSLTLSHRGTVDGATYTDVHAQLPALRLLMLISLAAAVLFIINIWRRGWVFPIIAVGLWGFISIVIGTIYPAFIQQFKVKPNELTRETPYIKRNIAATRSAFNLDGISDKAFNFQSTLNDADTRSSQETLDNVRLYDPDPAGKAFHTQQRLYPFYEFRDVDVDRYKVGGETSKPVIASVRELDLSHLPNNSWTNQHLVYTHGYGVVAAAADQVAGDQPSYLLSGIPETGDLKSQVDPQHAGIYFGEDQGGYAVVHTKVPEQEAAGNGQTKATQYTGKSGVQVSSFLRKAALAARFGDWTFLWSSQVDTKSRVIYLRDVKQRVQTVAPFLRFDHDPYPVVVNGRIIWVLDAYTTTNNYPYSQSIHPSDLAPGSGLDTDFNYVRNSVKATVDAYDGTVSFYIVDKTDPIINTYRKAFPGMFQDATAMPAGLRDHWRYPEDIFDTQTEQYTQYHITDPVQFYNKQNIWDIAPSPEASAVTATSAAVSGNNGGRNNTLAASGDPIQSLYLTMQLPGQTGQEFVLQREFVPRRAANLSAFIFARTDGENYGKLVVYSVADSTAPSPAQAATAILSDQFISSQFTLLNQGGSHIDQGQVQLIPVGNAIVYVRSVLVEGQGSQTFPRYRFVVAATGDEAVLGLDVNDAITGLLTGKPTQAERIVKNGGSLTNLNPSNPGGGTTTTTTTPTTPTSGPPPPTNASAQTLLNAAQVEFDAANAALAAKDLGRYQEHVQKAQTYVDQALVKLGVTQQGTTTTSTPP
jgi:uncharacterized membrane protein (UPF0182 family)